MPYARLRRDLGWLTVLLVMSGCAFEPAGSSGDGVSGGDAGADAGADPEVDAGIDAGPMVCSVERRGDVRPGPMVGGTGGSERPVVTCPSGQLPIAISFDLTVNRITNHGNEQLVTGVRVRCGTMTWFDGAWATAPGDIVSALGNTTPNCSQYRPTTTTTEVGCPAGRALVGLDVNRPDATMFNRVVLRCGSLSPTGQVDGDVIEVPVANSGPGSTSGSTAVCPSGTALVELSPRAGCGLDGLTLGCAPLGCGPNARVQVD